MTRTGLQSNICIVNILPYSFLSYILPTSWLLYWVTFTKPRSSVDHQQVNWMDSSFWSSWDPANLVKWSVNGWSSNGFSFLNAISCQVSSVWLSAFLLVNDWPANAASDATCRRDMDFWRIGRRVWISPRRSSKRLHSLPLDWDGPLSHCPSLASDES